MDGILLFNKPILWTSHDAVDFIRRRIGQRLVGHAGTLDPLATGLLVILIGKATKLSQELSSSDKEYAGSLTLGIRTDTQDLEGKIISSGDFSNVSPQKVEAVFSKMTGVQQQVPPRFSAVKKKGKSLYAWARQGTVVEADSREITIPHLTMTEFLLPDIYFSMSCSKGTYVRSICDLIGERLGCGAVLSSLARTRSGSFLLNEALNQKEISEWSLDAIEKRLIRRPDEPRPSKTNNQKSAFEGRGESLQRI